jgi:two-component system sensor histidine kinase RegB
MLAALDASLADRPAILARWLVGLRTVVFAFLLATLPVAERVFGYHVRYSVALPAIGVVALANLVAHRALARSAAGLAASVPAGVAFDLVAMTTVLAASGGAANPLSALFFVHVALAASLLPARTTFALAGFAAALFAALFLLPSGACCPNHPQHGAFSTHLVGMWLAFVLGAGLVAYFLTRVRRELEAREAEIVRLRREADEAARFVALGTLAAGTAHELATPLGTVAVLAGEIAGGEGPEAIRAQARQIGEQVRRCREVIGKMRGGGARQSAPVRVALRPAAERAIATWRAAHPDAAVELGGDADARAAAALSSEDVEAAVCALLDNALHATRAAGASEPIRVVVESGASGAEVRVEDAGTGVALELVGRLGEPFLTTKAPGDGMGLGLYLVRTLLEQVGGRLEIAARPRGTAVTLHLGEAGA